MRGLGANGIWRAKGTGDDINGTLRIAIYIFVVVVVEGALDVNVKHVRDGGPRYSSDVRM